MLELFVLGLAGYRVPDPVPSFPAWMTGTEGMVARLRPDGSVIYRATWSRRTRARIRRAARWMRPVLRTALILTVLPVLGARYAVGNGTNWNSTTSWSATSGGASGASVPLATDNVLFDANSPGNITINVASVCRSLDLTGFTHTLIRSAGLSIGDATAGPSNIALKCSSTMTWGGGSTVSIVSTSATQQTVDFGGITFGGAGIIFNGTGGSWILASDFTNTGATGITVTRGSFDSGSFNITFGGNAAFNSNNSNARSITLGTSTIQWNTTGAGTCWNTSTSTNLTFSGASATYFLASSTTNMATWNGGGLSFGTLRFVDHSWTIADANTWVAWDGDGSSTTGVTWSIPGGATQTITGSVVLTGISPTSGRASLTTGGTVGTISLGASRWLVDQVAIQFTTVTGNAATYYAYNSVNSGSNTGITFWTPYGDNRPGGQRPVGARNTYARQRASRW